MLFSEKVLGPTISFLLFACAVAALHLLWGGKGGNVSYREMACGFEDRAVNCVDSIPEWNEGLSYYDSTLAATGDTLNSLKSLLWNYWNVEFVGPGNDAVSREVFLPLQVLSSKKSGCMGLAWLALMVAEARNIDLHAVLLPGHVFMRYGETNLEPNRRGYSYTEAEYREKYKDKIWTGFEFRPLSPRMFVGLAAFNMGNTYLKENPSAALKWYRVSEDLFPQYPGLKVNQNIAKNNLPE